MPGLPGAIRAVYPRECGGTTVHRAEAAGVRGLSPRVRGNRDPLGLQPKRARSIPASAGEPLRRSLRPRRDRVYPRECGGTASGSRPTLRMPGLSPRVRGNPPDLNPRDSIPGSIPASAGEPGNARDTPAGYRVYPRECGGTSRSTIRQLRQQGLSPRVRGNRGPVRHAPRAHRSIPASAGEPLLTRRSTPTAEVYPRECGGTSYKTSPRIVLPGLSPRVRGNRPRCPRA